MGWLTRMATKAMVKTVRKSLPNASNEKLMQHYRDVSAALEMSDDADNDLMLVELRLDISHEMDRRGIIPTIRGHKTN